MIENRKGTTILVVDDEPTFRESVAFSFQMAGFTVIEAANGNEGFDMLSKHKIDVILSDIRMPDGDGVEFLERVRERHASLPVMAMMTGYSDVDADSLVSRGATHVFCKPFDIKELLAVIDKALE